MPSTRSELVTARTYCRPLPDGQYETWEQVCDRVIRHQEWLWTRATGDHLSTEQAEELCELHQLMLERVALPAGRILWMGGTEQARKTEVSMFNCAFHVVRDVYSAVDAFYLLLNSCGVGFKPESGLLNGFPKPVEVQVNLNHRKAGKGNPENKELWYTEMGKSYYHLIVGDSGLAWAKALGKLLALKKPVDIVKLDFREIRPPGSLLAGYGWLSSGPYQIAEAFERVCSILNRKADMLLDEIDILDIINLVGTTLTSRRSAEIALLHAHHPLAEAFADAKRNHFERAPWRSQSNNSLVFWKRPTRLELRGLFQRMLDAGGSEPGLYNGEAALRRAPWFAGTNPCGEILLPDGGLCNLCEVDLTKVTPKNAERVFWLIARANYRQTCVYLKDDVLSDRWHETQEFLRLCGVGITGVVKWMDSLDNDPWEIEESLVDFREFARMGADDMADELELPRSKAVTTIKPSGTLSKVMDTTEGLHRPLGRYIFNWIKFDKNDRLVEKLRDAQYSIKDDPYSSQNCLVCFPVDNGPGDWQVAGGAEVNLESAWKQLNRYKLMMDLYVEHNASVTISYSPEEIPDIVTWLYENWDSYVGVSFILRTDPTKTAEDLGYPYLPQEVVTRDEYDTYTQGLLPINIHGGDLLDLDECEGGACPIR